MKRLLVRSALCAALCPLVASAEGISHSYVEVGLGRQTFDVPSDIDRDLDFDGGYIRGSVELGETFYAFGGYNRGTNDRFVYDIDLTETQAGIGYAHGLNPSTELIVEAGYLGRDMEGSDFDGGRFSTGLRAQFGSRVEGWAKASYTDGNFADGDISAQAGALLKLSSTWGVTGEVDANENANRYTLGVRASF